MKIVTRKSAMTEEELRREIKMELAVEVAKELDQLVDHMDAFLEMRLTAEITELEDDIAEAMLLRSENAKLKDEITYLSMQLLAHATGQFSADIEIK